MIIISKLIQKLTAVSLLTAILFLVSGCSEDDVTLSQGARVISDHANNPYVNAIPLLDDTIALSNENEGSDTLEGESLFVWSGDQRYTEYGTLGFDGIMTLDTPQDTLHVFFENLSPNERDFILKVFYNYEEVSFCVLGVAVCEAEFVFSLEGNHEVTIPIQLDNNVIATDTINKLTVGIFADPNLFSMTVDSSLWRPRGMLLNFEINYGFREELILYVEQEEPVLKLDGLMFHGLMINQDFDPVLYQAYFPSNPLQVRRGEEVELAFLANATLNINEALEDYLIIAMLDWEQISMNGKPYLYVNVTDDNENVGHHGRFTIEVDRDLGSYEFIAFIVANPVNENSDSNFFPLEMATRFTIEVIE